MDKITFNVCGKKTIMYRDTIMKRGGTLKDLVEDFKEEEMFFDENIEFFDMMLEYYRTGILIKPAGMHDEIWKYKIKYWCIEKIYTKKDYYYYFGQLIVKRDIDNMIVNKNINNSICIDIKKYLENSEKYQLYLTEYGLCILIGYLKDTDILVARGNRGLIYPKSKSNIKKTHINIIKDELKIMEGKGFKRNFEIEEQFFEGLD